MEKKETMRNFQVVLEKKSESLASFELSWREHGCTPNLNVLLILRRYPSYIVVTMTF